MNRDSDLDLEKLTEIIQELSLESNSTLSDASQNLEYKSENNHFTETDNGNYDKESIQCKKNLQKFDLNKNIENDYNKNANIEYSENNFSEKASTQVLLTENISPIAIIENVIEDNQFFKEASFSDSSSSEKERFDDDIIKKVTEHNDRVIELEPLRDSSSSNSEGFYEDVIKKELKDEEHFTDLSLTDLSSSSSDDDDDNDDAIERGGPEKNKTKKHKETFYERRVSAQSASLGKPRFCHPSSSAPILKNNYRHHQQTQTTANFPFGSQQTELGSSSLETSYVNSPDSGFGSPSSSIASPSALITSSQFIFPLTPSPSPVSASCAVSLSTLTASPSEDVFPPSTDISSSPSCCGSPSQPINPSSTQCIPYRTSNVLKSSHDISLPASASSPLVDIFFPSSHFVSSLPPIASSRVVRPSALTLDPALPFDNKKDDKEEKIRELVNSFIEAQEFFKERRELQRNSHNPDSNHNNIEQFDKNDGPVDSEKTNIAENLENENTSLEEVISHLIISDLFKESDEVSDEWWTDSLNDLYDSICNTNENETAISNSRNSTSITSEFPEQWNRADRQVTSGEQKISYRIKDNAKTVLRNSECFDVKKYLEEISNVLMKIKYQEKNKEKIKIIDWDERENYKSLNQTNLHSAVIESNVEKVLCLVETLKRYDEDFFDINCRDANRKTALDYAVKKNIPLLVKYLKENNAVPSISV